MNRSRKQASSYPAVAEVRDALGAQFAEAARRESSSTAGRFLRGYRLRTVLAGLAALALLGGGAAAGILASSDGTDAPAGQGASPPISVSEPGYTSLADLAAKSDLVLVGTVKGTELVRGVEKDPSDPNDQGLDRLNVTLSVDEALKGSPPKSVTVVTDELLYKPPHTERPDWRTPGTRILAFLRHGSPASLLVPMNVSQSVYRIDDAGKLSAVVEPNALSARIASMPLSQVRGDVRESVQRD